MKGNPMLDPRVKKLAKLLVEYSLKVEKGEKVLINYIGSATEPLAKELISAVLEQGGIPIWFFDDSPLSRRMAMGATEEQMKVFGELHRSVMEQVDCYIGVRGSENKFDMADVPVD